MACCDAEEERCATLLGWTHQAAHLQLPLQPDPEQCRQLISVIHSHPQQQSPSSGSPPGSPPGASTPDRGAPAPPGASFRVLAAAPHTPRPGDALRAHTAPTPPPLQPLARRCRRACAASVLPDIFSSSSSIGGSTRPTTSRRMDDSLGNQIATSAVPGVGYNRVPSSSRLATGGGQPTGEPVTWDEMGQLGLHKALNEYYKLSDSQRNLRMCQRGGAPSILCCMAHTLLIPQLPAAVSPPALFATAGWLLYAAGWLLYQTAAITIPLALWLAFAAGGSLSLSPAAVAAAARLHPAAGAAAARLAAGGVALPPPLTGHPLAATLVLPALLVVLRLAERAVLARWQQQWDRQHARVTAADVQARYEGWALPGTAAASPVAPLAAVGQQQEHVRRQQLELLRREVGALWAAVYGGESPPLEQLEGLQEIAAVVGRLCADTGVEVPPAAAAGNTGVDSRFLLSLVRQVQAAVGVA